MGTRQFKMETSELYHHGIKGMKWGIRRNRQQLGDSSDGEAKKAKRSAMLGKLSEPTVKNGKNKDNISPAEKITGETGKAISNASNVVSSVSKIKKSKQTSDAPTMTDQELRDAISRMNLEKQYNSLSSERVSNGMNYTSEILGIVGSVVGITTSSLAIMSTIKGLKSP